MSLRILGAMSGTSCDGLDVSVLEFEGPRFQELWSASAPYPSALRKDVLQIQKPATRVRLEELLELHQRLGQWYARELGRMIEARPEPQRPHIIGNHGQTVAHFPKGRGRPLGSTLQLGEPTRIGATTGLTVVCSFREGDLSAGGEGAPLATLYHRYLAEQIRANLGQKATGIALHNLGGMSNLTYVQPDGNLLAFDTGPGNAWIDAATEHATRGKLKYDRDGRLGARGHADERAIREVMKFPFFKKRPPKSTGRDDFPFEMLFKKTRSRKEDLITTATELTAASVAAAYENFILKSGMPLTHVYVCGGGAKNPTLISALQRRMPQVKIASTREVGVDPGSVEAQAFAMLSYLSLQGKSLGGSWTGSRGFAPPAHVIPGKNWSEVLNQLTHSPP